MKCASPHVGCRYGEVGRQRLFDTKRRLHHVWHAKLVGHPCHAASNRELRQGSNCGNGRKAVKNARIRQNVLLLSGSVVAERVESVTLGESCIEDADAAADDKLGIGAFGRAIATCRYEDTSQTPNNLTCIESGRPRKPSARR